MEHQINDQSYHQPHRYFIILAGCVAALGGLLFGFDTGVISGAILFIAKQFQLSALMNGLVVSSALLGALFGSFLSGRVSDYFGRRRLLIALGVIFIVGTFLTVAAHSIPMLLIGRNHYRICNWHFFIHRTPVFG